MWDSVVVLDTVDAGIVFRPIDGLAQHPMDNPPGLRGQDPRPQIQAVIPERGPLYVGVCDVEGKEIVRNLDLHKEKRKKT